MKNIMWGIAISGLMIVSGFSMIEFPKVYGAGFGATCLNRHDASIKNVLVWGPGIININYTGSGDVIMVGNYWGYWVDVYLTIDPAIMMNGQTDTSNGTVFVRTNAGGGAMQTFCISNIRSDQTALVVETHVENLTGFQNVIWGTGTHSGQYNITWIEERTVT